MSEKNNIPDENDVFSRLVRQKLENHTFPVDEDLWAGIERKLAATKPKRRIPIQYWIASGVAAMIALLLLIRPVQDTSSLQAPNFALQQEQSVEKGQKQVVPYTEPASDLLGTDNEESPQSAPATSEERAGLFSRKQTTIQYADNNTDPDLSLSDKKKEKSSKETIIDLKENHREAEGESTRQDHTAAAENEKQPHRGHTYEKIDILPDLNDYPEIKKQTGRQVKKQRMMLAAAISMGNIQSGAGQDGITPITHVTTSPLISTYLVDIEPEILNITDYSNAHHYAPVSVGIRIEKPINERLSIGSGLIYTYLRSEYRYSGRVDQYAGNIQLHYLGVPLQARVKALKGPGWNIYASAGIMVEKGIRSIYTQEVEKNISKTNVNVNSAISGLQWSLNSALGLDFRLYKYLSLFIEPQLTYYLENNQPMSARTEQPLNIGLNGGLRIEL